MEDVFATLQDALDAEQQTREDLREAVRVLEHEARRAVAVVNRAHAAPAQVLAVVDELQDAMAQRLQPQLARISMLLPKHQYFRFHSLWTSTLSSLCFLVCFMHYVRCGELATPKRVADVLQVPVDMDNTHQDFHVRLEDYLHGVIQLVAELARLAVNAATVRDVERVQHIAAFLKQVHAGFQMLNLKNDALRRRFDGIKYDVKKVEEVMYDLSLRGLLP